MCGGRANCDKLWKIWYALFVVAIHGFLTYNAVHLYMEYKREVYDPRYGGVWNEAPMNFYMGMMILSLALLPVFVYCALVKVGNFANDGVIIGKDTDNIKLALMEMTRKGRSQSLWKRMKRHFLPFSCYLHAIAAYALLLPKPTLLAEQIKNEVVYKSQAWHSDLSFLFPHDIGSNMAQSNGVPGGSEIWPTKFSVSPEMCNWILALTLLTIRFPSTFWYSSRPFALVFSVMLFCTAVHLVFNFAAFSVLFQVSRNPDCIPNGLYKPFFGPWVCLVLESLGCLLILASQIVVFEYGHVQFLHSLRKYRQYFGSTSDGCSDAGSASAMVEKAMISSQTSSASSSSSGCCFRFWPNATALVLLVIFLSLKIPLAYEFMQIYWAKTSSLMLAGTVMEVIYMCCWLLMWKCFTVKTSWRFQVNIPIQTVSQISHEKIETQEPVYGCFHENQTLSQSSNSSDPPRLPGGDCGSESSKASSGGRGNHYVYLQSNMPTIPTISEHMDGGASDASYETPPNSGSVIIPHGYIVRRGSRANDPTYATLASVISGHPGIQNGAENGMDDGSLNGTGGSLNRNSRTRRSGNRVTFKEHHDMIPGSPAAAMTQHNPNMPNSDSGIALMGGPNNYTQFIRVKSPAGGNYEDYQMFGNLFNQQGNYAPDMYNGSRDMADYRKVPDILMNEQGVANAEQQHLMMSDCGVVYPGQSSSGPYGGSLQGSNHMTMSMNGSTDMEMSTDMGMQYGMELDQSLCSQV